MSAKKQSKAWVLTDVASHSYVDEWRITSQDLGLPGSWSVSKRRLHGGFSDGVDLIDVDNGVLAYSVCPTRGMGIWRGRYQDWSVGWQSPVRGPVHPSHVDRGELGGIGWLQGFDEWIVRCGLNNNGGPAVDHLRDNTGAEQSMSLPLHGKIANIPAHYVAVEVELEPPYGISVMGVVEESMLFFPKLSLSTVIRTTAGAPEFSIHDSVTNRGSQPAELELLYHCNFGPPLLGEGSRFRAPIRRLAPINENAARALDGWNVFPGPTAGIVEECFLMQLAEDPKTQQTLTMLEDQAGSKACALRFSTRELPWFTLWRNPGAVEDGYVTGLEPGTDLPNAKPFEREQGRVLTLAPGVPYETHLTVELAGDADGVAKLRQEINAIQETATPRIDQNVPPDLAPVG